MDDVTHPVAVDVLDGAVRPQAEHDELVHVGVGADTGRDDRAV